jgi:hypothetical protein
MLHRLKFPIQQDTLSETSTDNDEPQFNLGGNHKTNTSQQPSKVKTSLCRNYVERNFCPYGTKCQFAHGVHELRCNVDENSYKTKHCKAFTKKAYCHYGFRCNFLHQT